MSKFFYKYERLLTKILRYSKNLYLPPNNGKKINLQTNSWFNMNQTIYKNVPKYDTSMKKPSDDIIIKCEKIKIYPTIKQKDILISWMNCYIKMYNETISIFKRYRMRKKNLTRNCKKIRTYHMKYKKEKIIKNSQLLKYNSSTKVNSHVLDYAIKQACSNYKSCLTNLRRNNIKHFRLRYLKQTKRNKIIIIEKAFVAKNINTFCSKIFTENFKWDNDFKLKNIKKDFIIHYDNLTGEFYLLNPVEDKTYKSNNKKNTISLDPGIRKFMVGFTNNKTVEICTNLKKRINKLFKKIDNVKNENKSIKRKVEQHYYKKIKNTIYDMHWKVIKYLTDNYENILIGNLSTKSIIRNRPGNYLNKNTKRIASFMRLYVFKQRLQFKCLERKIGFKEIDEAYTSKTCSKCGYLNYNLGGNEIFKCKNCKYKIDRDINGARNILINSMEIFDMMKAYKKILADHRKIMRG